MRCEYHPEKEFEGDRCPECAASAAGLGISTESVLPQIDEEEAVFDGDQFLFPQIPMER